ncbi:hypothetical protein NQ317_010935 [Molorchus minor]|uniref:CDP-diacylglycerol--glycerol-3-phosphate 3-phosphatidyltransferase n=1 Tax=Molorchus minor TaxID=1323400 RepID=A0ABQ9J3D4_9CUCU|nr:hypothetical protein NQ317_010935 [Molorchus minor]
MDTLIRKCKAQCNILMAHPEANGFFGAKGLAGGIPWSYSLIAQKFMTQLNSCGQGNRINLYEYLRKGWTYHAKGYYPPNRKYPYMTLVGSPNFGERSVKRDLESQLCIVTENEDLRKELHDECTRLYKMGIPAETERPVPVWISPFVSLFRSYY